MINDQAPAAPSVPDDAPPVTGSAVGRFTVGLLLLAFAGVTGLFAPFLVMASDGCSEGDARTICSTGAQQIVGTLPVAAAFVAALLTVVGMGNGGTAGRRSFLVAPCLLVLAWVVSYAIAGT
ncbi:hypothetical protein [Streptomyces sp. NRRL S-1813]|uniref:hypothetical protein n=1 Tax=Streptomyces sp. NRRL S-1813 TaxID=1463888 RepID=UPI001F18D570|nr:hypothetical protein [Streptomyces sp. NRRL S-1813]